MYTIHQGILNINDIALFIPLVFYEQTHGFKIDTTKITSCSLLCWDVEIITNSSTSSRKDCTMICVSRRVVL